MILSQAINIRSCIVCFAYQSPNEVSNYVNDQTGHLHRFVYLTGGTIYTEVTKVDSDTPDITYQLVPYELYDINHSRGKYIKGVTTDVGAEMVFFNPIPADSDIKVQIYKDKQTLSLESIEKSTIVCLSGSITANGKVIEKMQYAALPLDKATIVELKDGAICAVVTK